MEPVERLEQPVLRNPRALVAFEGWNDASEAASGAVSFLLGQYEPEPFALIHPEQFFNFAARRPFVEIDEGGTRHLSWPTTKCYGFEGGAEDHDLVVILGEEPHLRWKTFAGEAIGLLEELEVERIVILGGFIGQVAHTLPVPIVGVATDPELVARHGLAASRYQGPTGIVGVLMEACRLAGLPAISLWAAVPHYLATNANPKAMLALLTKAGEVLELSMDTSELAKVAEEFESRVDAAMAESAEFAQYVKRLESTAGDLHQVEPEAGRVLVEEIEQFLRERGV